MSSIQELLPFEQRPDDHHDEFVRRIPLSSFRPARAFDPRFEPRDMRALHEWLVRSERDRSA